MTSVIVVLLGFITLPSTGGVEPEFAFWVNPAGMFQYNGIVARVDIQKNSSTSSLLSISNNFAVGISSNGSYLAGGSIETIQNLRIGLSATVSSDLKKKNWLLGLLYRTEKFGIGFTIDGLDRSATARAGIAFNQRRKVVLYTDISKPLQGNEFTLDGGIGVHVKQGAWLNSSVTFNNSGFSSWSVGLDISIGRLRTGVQGNRDAQTISVAYTKTGYKTEIHPPAYLYINLNGPISEDRKVSIFGYKPSFTDFLMALRKANKTPWIKGIFIEFQGPGLSFAQVEELRSVLEKIEKPKVFYAEELDMKGYYLATVADKIVLAPTGSIFIPGFYIRKLFFKGTLEKLGMYAEFERFAEYKSAVEVLTRKGMSPEDRKQTQEYLKDILNEFKTEVSESRGLPDSLLDAYMDTVVYFEADEAMKYRLVDTLLYPTEVGKYLRDKFHTTRRISWVSMVNSGVNDPGWAEEKPVIAVLTLEGSIVRGESGSSPIPIIGGKYFGSSSVIRALNRLKKSNSVKAVVIRINSPGGSALASELIWRAIKDLKEKKPVVISMGALAASGGYYISSTGAKVVADNTTLTGSIGILGGKIVMKDFYEQKLGVTSDTVKSHPHADIFSEWRGFTEMERKGLKRILRSGYDTFIKRVSEGRGIPVDSVDAIGRGHIWSGKRAIELGLVDRIGTVLDAIDWAKDLANIKGDYSISVLTTQKAKFLFGGLPGVESEDWFKPIRSIVEEPYVYRLPIYMSNL